MGDAMAQTDPENVAAVHVQRVVRGFLGRMAALRQANLIYEKIYDPRTHIHYYYNTITCETAWQPPAVCKRILGEFGDLDTVAATYTEEEAAVMLQAAWRRRVGRRTVRALLASVVTKVFDDSTGAHYYYNSLTGETSWSKPALFGSEDVESYLPGGTLAESGEYGQGQENQDLFGTGDYGYDQGWAGEAWSEQQQTGGNGNTDAVGVDTTSTEGYEGWVWNDSSGWYYDEAVAAQQLAAGTRDDKSMAGAETFGGGVVEDPKTATRDVSSSGDESDSDSSDSSSVGEARGGESEGGEGGDKTKQRRRRKKGERKGRLAPRRFPRCKAQRLVDDAEDSVDGARPELLNLSMLGMTRVTSRVYGLDWLKILDLSSNRLSRISPDLAGMECLVDMNLRHNNIGAIPDDFEALTQLRHLRLGYNRLRGFRGNIYLMSSLQTLDLEHNRLKEMPLHVGDLQLLKRTREWEVGLRLLKELLILDVSYNSLKVWPAQVEGCQKLHDLRLDHNKLQEVPDTLGDNTALTNLNLGSNALKHLPDTINHLRSLKSLDLSHNELEDSPIRSIAPKEKGSKSRLVRLETLRLEGNRLPTGPAAVETLTSLTELDVSNNPIKDWQPNLSRLRRIKHLRMKAVGLHECPEGLGQMDKLETLDLSENRIDIFDSSASTLFKLKKLDLKGNRIKDIGSCVGTMMSLTYLDAAGNGLEVLAPELSRCTALEHLDISGGEVETLSEGLSRLPKLRCLRAQNNRLTIFPSMLACLTGLEELNLCGNKLTGLPDSLETLTKMRFADLSRNQMESPPPVTRRWPLLTHLVLSRNPLRGRRGQSRRLLQAARRGHEAMHRGDWKEAVRHLNVAAAAYDDAIHGVPDFPDPVGGGPSLAQTRPQDTDTFHHANLAVAHLQRAREVASEIEGVGLTDQSSVGSASVGASCSAGGFTEDGSSLVSIGTTEREERHRKEIELLSLREAKAHHFQAAGAAMTYADQLEQLSRPMGRAAGVWLGRAAVALDAGDPASALHDLERASVQLRGNAKVRALLARARIDLGQYERGLLDCRVASRLLGQEERSLTEREAEQQRKGNEAARQAAAAEAIHQMEERAAARERMAAAASAKADAAAKTNLEGEGEEAAKAAASDKPTGSAAVEEVTDTHSADVDERFGTTADENENESEQDVEITGVFSAQETGSNTPQPVQNPNLTTRESLDGKVVADGGGRARRGESKDENSIGLSPAREELARQKADIARLVAQAEEGMMFLNQSIDMADILRGFAITSHGVPVRDMAVDGALLLQQGRSVLRDRHRRLMALEAAKKRSRKRDVALMERSLRQAAARQASSRLVKARKEAAMVKYREVEDAWERKLEEQESSKKTAAAKKRVEQEVKAAYASTAAEANADSGSTSDDSEQLSPAATPAAPTEMPKAKPKTITTAKQATTARARKARDSAAKPNGAKAKTKTPTATGTLPVTAKSIQSAPTATVTAVDRGEGEQHEDDDEEDDPELQKVLAGRLGRANNRKSGRLTGRGDNGAGRGK